jgi:hypothetical protein
MRQGSKVRDQGPGARDQRSGVRDQRTGIRDQGLGIKGQESGIRGQGSAKSERTRLDRGGGGRTVTLILSAGRFDGCEDGAWVSLA